MHLCFIFMAQNIHLQQPFVIQNGKNTFTHCQSSLASHVQTPPTLARLSIIPTHLPSVRRCTKVLADKWNVFQYRLDHRLSNMSVWFIYRIFFAFRCLAPVSYFRACSPPPNSKPPSREAVVGLLSQARFWFSAIVIIFNPFCALRLPGPPTVSIRPHPPLHWTDVRQLVGLGGGTRRAKSQRLPPIHPFAVQVNSPPALGWHIFRLECHPHWVPACFTRHPYAASGDGMWRCVADWI